MLKWLLIILAALVALIMLVVIIGLMIPRAHTASRTAKFNQTPDTIWSVISDFQSQPQWRQRVSVVERLEDRNGHPVWREIHGRGDRFDAEVIEFDPPRRMVTRIVDNSQFGGTWTWEIQPAKDGCTLTITEDGEIYNPIFRVVARFIMGYHATMDGYLTALGQKFGEQIELVDE